MTANCAPWRNLATAVAVALASAWLSAGEPARPTPTDKPAATLPAPADLIHLSVHPGQIALKGADDAAQIIVTGQLAGDKLIDLTGSVVYASGDGNLVAVSVAGRVTPRADGKTEITVQYGDRSVKVPVTISHTRENLPINFANQIVPIFTKLGCNSGGCHGKASGQNGFKLSLLGFEPEIDYASLVKEGRGRRTFPAAPDNSLLLLKATGQLPHGGGKKMEIDSEEYRLVRRWIASGLPLGKADDPVVTRLSVFPDRRVMARGSRQQLAVYAHYSDGSAEDITRRAQFESNDIDIASVDASGLVHTHSASGEAAVMVRYQGHVSVYRATVPLGLKVPDYQFPVKTLVDNFTLAKYRLLGLVPAELCTDEEFIRRATIDICGTLPTPEEITKFVANADPNKRDKLVDELLERPEYGYYFANKWSAILRNKRRGQPQRAQGTFAFHAWLRDALQRDMPYDRMVREIIAATGDEHTHPPVVWYWEITTPQQFVDDAAQLFLGQRLACAQCHHHPYEKWSQDDYWGLAAFFGRVGRKQINEPGGVVGQANLVTRIFVRNSGNVNNERTRQPARIKPLDADPIDVPAGDDPRQKLVDWMVDPKNPFFAKALVNRYWAHFFGRGIVHEPDDMRVTNPPSNEELLDALAKDFIDKKFSIKELVRTIAKSRTYQLSAVPNEFNKFDRQNFARFYPRPLNAEVLLDAISQATDSPTVFNGLPQDVLAPKRAIMLPDEGFTTYFLEVFGKPQGNSACECERVNEANLAQALHLLNSDEIQNKLARANARCDNLARDNARPDKDKVEELFLWTFGRKPSDQEIAVALAHIDKLGPQQKKTAYENILWALINAKEFRFND
jgi:hypothetical protein